MKPIRLAFQAFGSYRRETVIDFTELGSRKLFLIDGETGSGKSTIFDAMCYALYAVPSGKDKEQASEVANIVRCLDAAPEVKTWVKYTFSLREETYRVERYLRYDKAQDKYVNSKALLCRLERDGSELKLAEKTKQVTERVEDLLHLSIEQFRQVILIPQGAFRNMLLAPPGERQKLMRELFGTQRQEQIALRLKERSSELRKQEADIRKQNDTFLEQAEVRDLAELEARLAERQEQQQALAARARAQAQSVSDSQKALTRGRELTEKFQAAAMAQAAWQEVEAKRPEADRQKERLAAAQRAAQLQPEAEQAGRAGQQARQAAEALRKAEAELSEAIRAEQLAQQRLRAAEEEAPLRLETQARLVILQEQQKSIPALKKLQQECRSLTEEEKAAAGAQAEARDKLDKLQKAHQSAQDIARQLAEEIAGLSRAEAEQKRLLEYRADAEHLRECRARVQEKARAATMREKEAEQARQAAAECKENLQAQRQAFLAAQAYWLAQELKDGEACPVCGAKAHPRPAAAPVSGAVEKRVLDSLQQAAEKAEQKLKKAEKAAHEARLEHNTAATAAGEAARRLEGAPQQLEQALQEATAKVEALAKARKRQEKGQKWFEEYQVKLPACRTAYEQAARDWQEKSKALSSKQGELRQHLQQLEAGADSGAALDTLLERLSAECRATAQKAERLQQALEQARTALSQAGSKVSGARTAAELAARAAQQAREEAEQTAQEFAAHCGAAGFATPEDYGAALPEALRTQAGRDRAARELKDFELRLDRAIQARNRTAEAVEGLAPPDLEALGHASEEALQTLQQLHSRAGQIQNALENDRKACRLLQENNLVLEKLAGEYRAVSDIARLANEGGSDGVTFENFVLGMMLDDVLATANPYLDIMTSGQYRLQRGSRNRHSGLGGLDIEILDLYSRDPRHTSRKLVSLSGGESFEATLALAIGLGETVQAYNGGVHLETIFLDEGFGTLDVQHLNTALRVLHMQKNQGRRLVGIISHVDELRHTIKNRLEVRKDMGKQGSTARFVLQ